MSQITFQNFQKIIFRNFKRSKNLFQNFSKLFPEISKIISQNYFRTIIETNFLSSKKMSIISSSSSKIFWFVRNIFKMIFSNLFPPQCLKLFQKSLKMPQLFWCIKCQNYFAVTTKISFQRSETNCRESCIQFPLIKYVKNQYGKPAITSTAKAISSTVWNGRHWHQLPQHQRWQIGISCVVFVGRSSAKSSGKYQHRGGHWGQSILHQCNWSVCASDFHRMPTGTRPQTAYQPQLRSNPSTIKIHKVKLTLIKLATFTFSSIA